MEKTLVVINQLEQAGLIGRYAIGGAVAATRYIEPVQTCPDISNIFVAKAQRRLALAALSWEEKVAIVERMRRQSPKNMWRPRTGSAPAQSQKGAGQKA